MTRNKLSSLIAAALAAALLSSPAFAATGSLTAKVVRTLVTNGSSFGGCMVALSVSPATVLPSCAAGWLSFSCTGDFTDPVRAYRMLDQAQLAHVTGRNIFIQFTDAALHNGYCVATRIDVGT